MGIIEKLVNEHEYQSKETPKQSFTNEFEKTLLENKVVELEQRIANLEKLIIQILAEKIND